MDWISATKAETSSSSIAIRLTLIAIWPTLLSILQSTLFTATLLTFSDVSRAAGQQRSLGNAEELIWSLNVRQLGYTPHQHGPENGEFVSRIQPVCFLSNGQVLVSFVTREAPVALPRRGQSDATLPFRLHALFIDPETGHVQATREWPTASTNSRVLPVPGGKFIVFTPDQLLLYSVSDLQNLKQLDLPLSREAGTNQWRDEVSPGGKNLLISYEPRGEQSTLDNWQLKFTWIDLEELRVVQQWTVRTVEAKPRAISDDGRMIAWAISPGQGIHAILIGQIPNGPWRSIEFPRILYSSYDFGPFINDDTLFVWRGQGYEKDAVLWMGIVSTSGETIFQETFPKREGPGAISPGIPRSIDGRRFAVGYYKTRGGIAALDIAGDTSLERLMIFDLPSRRWTYSVDAKKQKIKAISGMSLSPDGSLLALINQDGVLQLYSIPNSRTQ